MKFEPNIRNEILPPKKIHTAIETIYLSKLTTKNTEKSQSQLGDDGIERIYYPRFKAFFAKINI